MPKDTKKSQVYRRLQGIRLTSQAVHRTSDPRSRPSVRKPPIRRTRDLDLPPGSQRHTILWRLNGEAKASLLGTILQKEPGNHRVPRMAIQSLTRSSCGKWRTQKARRGSWVNDEMGGRVMEMLASAIFLCVRIPISLSGD